MKFNTLQTNFINCSDVSKYFLDAYNVNSNEEYIKSKYKSLFSKENIKTFNFTTDGFFALILSLDGKIGVSLGESEAIVNGAKKAKKYGKDIEFLPLKKDGFVELTNLDDSFSYVFISSYIIDTYVKVDLGEVKRLTNAKIVSNNSADCENKNGDLYLLDCYKLCGQGGQGIILFDDELPLSSLSEINLLALSLSLEEILSRKYFPNQKEIFQKYFEEIFGEDLYYFVKQNSSLEYTYHVGLKGIKMRELIKSISLDDIYITNGEGCSLGLSKPSRIIQEMGYSEDESRWSLSLDFCQELDEKMIEKIVKKINKKYRQIKVLG